MKFLNADERKAKALKIMSELGLDWSYIEAFAKGSIFCFNLHSVVSVEESSALYQKVKSIEAKYQSTVFAVTHEKFDFGECYTLLIVVDEPYIEPYMPTGESMSTQLAYVWNLDHDHFCEFGSVRILSCNGRIYRIS